MTSFTPYRSISASAGSGKTFQLSYRTLRLLAMGVSPESIGAFTFSRKAAGEIFDSVVESLREAAESSSGAETASQRIELERSSSKFLQDLREVIRSLPHLKVGTLDAHFARTLSAISVELGLPPEFALQDDLSSEQVRLRREILNRLFQSNSLTEERAATFLELFEEATHGKSEKEFFKPMLEFLESHRSVLRSHPHRSAWKGPVISSVPKTLSSERAKDLSHLVRSGLEAVEMNDKARQALIDFAEVCADYSPGSVWSKKIKGTKPIQWVLEGSSPEFVYLKKTTDLSGPIWEGLQKLADHVVAIEWENVRRRTEALWAFLAVFEQAYEQEALPGGRLTFEDACGLMADFDQLSPSEIAFRLDGELDHWLLDEFQDTSRPQWRVLEPFLSEILQDPEQRRSLFLVGDVKQAIYGWRGGDAGLFHHVLNSWPQIQQESMATSFRSAQPILDAVNAIFDDLPSDEVISPQTSEKWKQAFLPHHAAKADLQGEAKIVRCEKEGPADTEIVMEHLHALPRECSIALLVRSNKEGDTWAALLREEGFQVSREGTSPLRDTTAIEVVLAGLKSIAHPADTFSKRLLSLAGITPAGIQGLEWVQSKGITEVVRFFTRQLLEKAPTEFTRYRLARLEQEALEFDQTRDPDIDAFLEHVDQLSLRESGGSGIRIMTIHQCKGLGFDAVILPLAGKAGFSHRLDGLVTSPPEEEQDWVTLLPPKNACARIPELARILEQEKDRASYETLCVLYVAMTRAKRSLLVTLPPPTKTPTVFGNWIAARLDDASGTGVLKEWGDEKWKAETRPEPDPVRPPIPFPLQEAPKKPARLEPSREQSKPTLLSQEFAHPGEDGRILGNQLHDLMEQVDFVSGTVDAFLDKHAIDKKEQIAQHIEHVWGMKVLQKPEGLKELWREQKFETLLPEGWVTGIFDRVVLFEDSAWIQDYKTNRKVTPETVDHYRPQMELYRRVLADMLGFEETDITCQLLFTSTGEVAKV